MCLCETAAGFEDNVEGNLIVMLLGLCSLSCVLLSGSMIPGLSHFPMLHLYPVLCCTISAEQARSRVGTPADLYLACPSGWFLSKVGFCQSIQVFAKL